jgi:hypothetical protein
MQHWTDRTNLEFERWWTTKTAAGYQYGHEALENVRFGFEGAQYVIAMHLLDRLSDDERLELFSLYCRSCGVKDPRCQCGNDE